MDNQDTTWRDRVKAEARELQVKLDALQAALDRPGAIERFGGEQWGLMIAQLNAMKTYLAILALRMQ